MTRLRSNDDAGFTLIELLLTTVIIGVITLPLGNLVIEYFRTTTQTQGRLHESHDAQITAAFFSQDVASIGRRDSSDVLLQSTSTSTISGVTACAAGITPVLVLAWTQYSVDAAGNATPTTIVVSYGTRIQTVGTVSQLQLIREHCTGSATPDATSVVAHNLSAAPVVTCSGNGATSCNDSVNVPSLVTMNMSLKDVDDTNASPYQISVSGQRRQT